MKSIFVVLVLAFAFTTVMAVTTVVMAHTVQLSACAGPHFPTRPGGRRPEDLDVLCPQ